MGAAAWCRQERTAPAALQSLLEKHCTTGHRSFSRLMLMPLCCVVCSLQAAGYGKVVSHVVIGLKTVKGTKQLKLDPTIYDSLQKERVQVREGSSTS
jgi:hypothetical protein